MSSSSIDYGCANLERRNRFKAGQDRYCLIVGHGRSGTNLALDALDLHPMTVCRNEPNEIDGSLFANIPGDLTEWTQTEEFQSAWTKAVEVSYLRKGNRDRFHNHHKAFFRNKLSAIIAESILPRRSFRPLTAAKSRGEWAVPDIFLNKSILNDIIPVYKILLRPHWITNTHQSSANQYVLHIIRSPLGFINSWYNRYITANKLNERDVHRANMDSVEVILRRLNGAMRSGWHFSTESLIESELWRWRYMNDTLYSELKMSPRYKLVHYRNLTQSAVDAGREIYDWLGLDRCEWLDEGVKGMRNTLFPSRHRKNLPSDLVLDLAESVLEGSPLRDHIARR